MWHFLCNRKLRSYYIKKLSGNCTAVETKDVARATRRRRRILQAESILHKTNYFISGEDENHDRKQMYDSKSRGKCSSGKEQEKS